MNAAVIILIIILIIAVLVGIGVGLYFAFRKKPETPENGPQPSPIVPVSGGDPVPPGTGSPGSGTDLTNFSISSVTDSTKFLTFTNPTGTLTIAPLFVSSDTNIPCDNYSWQNLTNLIINPNRPDSQPIPSVLKSNSTTFTLNQTIPFPLAGKLDPSPGFPTAFVTNQGVGTTGSLTFAYNNTTKSWCGPNEDVTQNLCLYLEQDDTVSAKPLTQNDNRFQWDIVPPFSCS